MTVTQMRRAPLYTPISERETTTYATNLRPLLSRLVRRTELSRTNYENYQLIFEFIGYS